MLGGKVRLESHDISEINFVTSKTKFFVTVYRDKLAQYVDAYEMGDQQVGVLYRNGHFTEILAPGSFKAVWKGVEDVKVDVIDISEAFSLADKDLDIMARGKKAGLGSIIATGNMVSQSILYVEIPDEHVGLLKVNGKITEQLAPGSYGYWKYKRAISVSQMDLRLQSVEVAGQEILTKDRVSLRINLSANYKVIDPMAVALKVNDFAGFVYKELQLKLREAVGTATLDGLLEDKDSLNQVIQQGLFEKLKAYGVELLSVGVKDIILPGDMKVILNKVVEAQKEAEANLIKRKEETQAMRSLHNTAKMMENNPVLIRMKELEALERVTERVDKITVYSGLDGVLNDLVKLAPVLAA